MENKSDNRKLTQKQIAKELNCSDSTIKRYRTDLNMNTLYNRGLQRNPTRHFHQTRKVRDTHNDPQRPAMNSIGNHASSSEGGVIIDVFYEINEAYLEKINKYGISNATDLK